MAFMSLEKKFSKKNKYYIILHCFFFCLIFAYFIERPHNTLSVFDEGVIKHILGPKYGIKASRAFSGKF